ncbi:hypothetical protein ACFOD4_20675 [Pseudoroseomonas globiformis]|uniref:DUF3592 domain-containing protein n=1 Tax=Teichococcus globiformis TaxID=2307229 RepID=A0ABV7G750_9PROT
MSLAVLGTVVALGLFIVDFAGRPLERIEGVVANRSWRAASGSMASVAVVTTSGQVGTTMVPTTGPERYEAYLQLEDQRPCAAVWPAHYETLRPGSQVAALVRRARLRDRIRISRVLDRGE